MDELVVRFILDKLPINGELATQYIKEVLANPDYNSVIGFYNNLDKGKQDLFKFCLSYVIVKIDTQSQRLKTIFEEITND